ncbi:MULTISPECIES: dihydroorotase family protein [Flavobacteriaceae]|uniref:dihydroorotase n=1 Tax=Flavobacteriaceae TaxID=49546 RepID=UPI0010AE687E|nr:MULTISPECIES: dihydroorotase [Flavobacteriaceae]NJB35521.1 dihydroorotase [Croceivirga sp. JEA036]TKD66175.1 dihydroorotase [Flavobacterium sp. ASW18X]
MNVLLKSAKIVAPNAKEYHLKTRDILIKNGKISAIEPTIENNEVKNLVLDNLHVSLGWFDSSVAFGEPGYEERETISNGLRVAALSGFTSVVVNPNGNPTPNTSSTIVFLKERGKGHLTDLYPLGNFTVDAEGKDMAELYDMYNTGAVGFFDYKRPISNANLLKIGLLYTQNFEGLLYSHPLDKSIKGKGVVNEGVVSTTLGLKGIPALAEELQIARDIFLLTYTGGKLHIPTISSAGAVKLVADAKKKGLNISCSVALQNLWFTDDKLTDFDTHFKLSPPLRTAKDRNALQKAVENGTIDFITTDHTPIDIEQKRIEFDNAAYGSIGLEAAFGVANSLFGIEKSVALLTKGRDRYGIEEPKLEVGAEANLSLFNPEEEYTFTSKNLLSTSKNCAYLGEVLKGKVYGSINNNKLLVK